MRGHPYDEAVHPPGRDGNDQDGLACRDVIAGFGGTGKECLTRGRRTRQRRRRGVVPVERRRTDRGDVVERVAAREAGARALEEGVRGVRTVREHARQRVERPRSSVTPGRPMRPG